MANTAQRQREGQASAKSIELNSHFQGQYIHQANF